jgi:hypothetical protein
MALFPEVLTMRKPYRELTVVCSAALLFASALHAEEQPTTRSSGQRYQTYRYQTLVEPRTAVSLELDGNLYHKPSESRAVVWSTVDGRKTVEFKTLAAKSRTSLEDERSRAVYALRTTERLLASKAQRLDLGGVPNESFMYRSGTEDSGDRKNLGNETWTWVLFASHRETIYEIKVRWEPTEDVRRKSTSLEQSFMSEFGPLMKSLRITPLK